ncbi:AAA family ATPase [Bifidobacterium longum]
MIRLKRLVLDDMRNISHGVLDFDDLPTGGSVTGIYGQNGSGKTTVIDAIGILRALLSGNMLPDTAGDVVSASAGSATVTATFLIGDKQKPSYLEYRVSMRKANPDSTRARVVAESVRIGDDPSRLGREVLGHRMEDSEADGFVSTPVYVWRSIEAVSSVKTVVSRTADRAYMEGRSFLFSRCATLDDRPDAEFLIDWAVARVRETNGVSSRSLTYINERFGEFVRLRETLCGYATNDIFVSTTRRGSYAAFAIIPIMEENPEGRNTEFPFDLLQPNPLTPGQAKRLGQTVESFDRILPTIVPGLHVLLKTGTAPSGKDGEDRVTAELFSRRGDVMVPFRCESETVESFDRILPTIVPGLHVLLKTGTAPSKDGEDRVPLRERGHHTHHRAARLPQARVQRRERAGRRGRVRLRRVRTAARRHAGPVGGRVRGAIGVHRPQPACVGGVAEQLHSHDGDRSRQPVRDHPP